MINEEDVDRKRALYFFKKLEEYGVEAAFGNGMSPERVIELLESAKDEIFPKRKKTKKNVRRHIKKHQERKMLFDENTAHEAHVCEPHKLTNMQLIGLGHSSDELLRPSGRLHA